MTTDNDKQYFSTLLTTDTHNRLKQFAMDYETGLGKWDYGVAIKILLDFYEQHSSVAQINMKLDAIVTLFQQSESEELQEEVKEDTGIEMLGGEVLEK